MAQILTENSQTAGEGGGPPLIGVYLLMLKGRVVYIGESMKMPERVATHRTNGRPFDQVFYIATKANQRLHLEATLIRAINPPQNRNKSPVSGLDEPPVERPVLS